MNHSLFLRSLSFSVIAFLLQHAQARALYATDYSPLGPGGKLVPLRWMAWESLLLVSSNLYRFKVTI